MSWPHRGSSGVRCALIAASAFAIYIAGDHARIARAEPSASTYTTPGSYGTEQRAEELYLDGVEKLDAGHPDSRDRRSSS